MSSFIAAGVTFPYTGTHASISGLAGFTRDTTLDGYHLRGAPSGNNPGSTGGASTHTHTPSTHNHGSLGHTHTGGTFTQEPNITTAQGGGSSAAQTHGHTTGDPGSATNSTTSSDAGSWNTASNHPAYYEVIYVKSDGTPTGIPDGVSVFWNSATGAAGWTQHVASKAKYPKAATAAGDAGNTGGSNTHVHTGVAHTHTLSHSHASSTTGVPSYGGSIVGATGGGPSSAAVNDSHTHTVSWSTPSTTTGSGTSADTGSGNGEPPYYTLPLMQNTSGVDKYGELNVYVAIWTGLLSAIPSGWFLCDGNNGTPDLRDKFIKLANAMGDYATTGGAAGHSHSSPAGHTHGLPSHSHNGTAASATQSTTGAGSGTQFSGTGGSHTHLISGGSTVSTTDGSVGSSGTGVQDAPSNANTMPPYYTVAFIMLGAAIDVDVTAPTTSISTPGLTVTWSFSGGTGTQQTKRVRLYASDQTTVVYDSGTLTSSTLSLVIDGADSGLRNSRTYYARVDVTDTNGVTGFTPMQSFTTSWAAPAIITGLTAAAVGGD